MKRALLFLLFSASIFAEQTYIRGHAEGTIRNNLPAQRNPYRTPHTMLLPGTFALRAESWCGAGDFVQFVRDHPGFEVFDKSSVLNPSVPVLLGIWAETRTDPQGEARHHPLPTSTNWIPLGHATVPIDGAATTTLRDIHKGRALSEQSIGTTIQDTLRSLQTLIGYRLEGQPRSYLTDAVDIYMAVQACEPFLTHNPPTDDIPSPLEVAQSFNVAVAPDSFLADAVVTQIDEEVENEVFASFQTAGALEANLKRYNLSAPAGTRVEFELDTSSGVHTVDDATNTDLWDLGFEVFQLSPPSYPMAGADAMAQCLDYASKVNTVASQAKLLAARNGLRTGTNCNSVQVPGIRAPASRYWWEFYNQNGPCAYLLGQEKSETTREQFTMLPSGSRHQLYETLFKTAAECAEDTYFPPDAIAYLQAKRDLTQLLLRAALFQDAALEFNDTSDYGGVANMTRITTKCFDDITPRPYFNTMFNSQIIGIAPQKRAETLSFESDQSVYRGQSLHPKPNFSVDGHLVFHDGSNSANDEQNSIFAVGEMSNLGYPSDVSNEGRAFTGSRTTPFRWWHLPGAISNFRPQSYYMILGGRGTQDPYATAGNPDGDRLSDGNYGVWTSHYDTAARFEQQGFEYALRIRGYGSTCQGTFFVKNDGDTQLARANAQFQMGGRV